MSEAAEEDRAAEQRCPTQSRHSPFATTYSNFTWLRCRATDVPGFEKERYAFEPG